VPIGAPDFLRRTREKATETRVFRWWGVLNPGETRTLIDLSGRDVTIEALEMSTNYGGSMVTVTPYLADGTLSYPLTIASKDGGVGRPVTPDNLNEHKSIMWSELIYDPTNLWYKLGLTQRFRSANGLKIEFRNPDETASHNLSVFLLLTIRG